MSPTMRVTHYATTLLFLLTVAQVGAVPIPTQTCSLWKSDYLLSINSALSAGTGVEPVAILAAQTTLLKDFLAYYIWMVNQPAYDAVHSGECATLGKAVWTRLGYSADFDVSSPGKAPTAGTHFNEVSKSSASSAKPASFVALASMGALAHLASKF
jgi:hypothetical protein